MPYKKTYTRRRYPMRRYKRRVYKRRPYSRRKSWGNRVRRAALKGNESKRFVIRVDGNLKDIAITDPINRTPLCRVPAITPVEGVGVLLKNERAGTSVMGTGIAIRIQFENLRAAEDMTVRIIVGYKKYDRTTATNDDIFMKVEDEKVQGINDFPSYFQRTIARLDRKKFKKMIDKRINLTAGGEDALASDSRMMKMWIPLRRPIQFEPDAVGNVAQTLDPVIYLMCYNKAGVPIAETPETCVRFSMENVFYFKDP